MSTSPIADAAVQPASRQMRKDKLVYWISTRIVCAVREAQAYVRAGSGRNPLKLDIRSLQQSETPLLGRLLRGRGIEASGGLQ